VAFPVVEHVSPEQVISVAGEVKAGYPTTELWRMCHKFFKCAFNNFSSSPRVFFSLTKFSNTEVDKRTVKEGKISGYDARAEVMSLLEVKEHGIAKYLIVEDRDFDCCILPIKELLNLQISDSAIQLYPDELVQINASTLLTEFVPSVIEASKTGQPRKRMKTTHATRTNSMIE